MDKVKEAAAAHGKIKEVFVFGEAEGATPFASLLKTDKEPPKVTIDPKEDIFIIPYSSGTTGLPKGVLLTHYNVVANLVQVKAVENDYNEHDVFIGVLPFFHMYAMLVILNLALHVGVKTVVMPKFDLLDFLKLAQDHKATYLHIVPPIVLALAKHPAVLQFDLSSVRVILSGAAPLGPDLEREVLARFPKLKIKQAYGLSEASPAISLSPSNAIKPGAAGLLLPNIEVKVIDTVSGQLLDHHTDGELCFRGPNVMKGYLNNPTSTAATIDADGFLRSGDIGHVDDDCHLYIVDRAKELIKYKGYQVAPAELEGLLLKHPAVADAAVIGIPDEEAGELPKAFVVLKPGQTVSAEEVIKYLEGQVAPHKKLRGGLEFIEKIPKSMSGKILRRELKAAEIAKRNAAKQ
jgi:acyl-CoA synthetase (AMP-forming)/AMP-acid ligase II